MARLSSSLDPQPRRRGFVLLLLAVVVLGALGGWWWQSRSAGSEDDATAAALSRAGIDADERAGIEAVVRAYILANPEIIPEAIDELRRREASAQIAPLRGALETPFAGAVRGNPRGTVTLVEFTDYACGYCRASVPEVQALIAANPELRVVPRELAIIDRHSQAAARMALAAADQGRYAAFHDALFASEGGVTPATIEAAARRAGLDLAKARAFAARPETQAELVRNAEMAQRLGIDGTPAWIVGDELVRGAVGRERLQQAIDAAKQKA